MPKTRKTLEERFWAKVSKLEGADACWLWNASRDSLGYGKFAFRGENNLAHRVSWFLETGVMPDLMVCHRCDNPPCVRHSHHFLGNAEDNIADAVKKGRWKTPAKKGADHNQAKLSEDQVRSIRSRIAAGETRVKIAADLNISAAYVSEIGRGLYWKHLSQ